MRLAISITLYFLLSFPAFSTTSCDKIAQCDFCSTDSQFQNAALNAAPSIPPGQDMLSCRVLVANLNSSQVRAYSVEKGEEPGFTYAFASVSPLTSAEGAEFSELFTKLGMWEASTQSIVIPGTVVNSGYELAGNSFAQNAVANYIIANHNLFSQVYAAVGGSLSLVDSLGFSFSRLLTIEVIFADGSTGVFKMETIGIGNSDWVVVETAFTDADGNTIYFDAADYAGQSGSVTGSGVTFLINRLIAGGWNVSGDSSDGGGGCSWNCVGDTCTLSCSSE